MREPKKTFKSQGFEDSKKKKGRAQKYREIEKGQKKKVKQLKRTTMHST